MSQLGCEFAGQNKTSQDRQQYLTKFASLKWFTFVRGQMAYFSAFAGEGQHWEGSVGKGEGVRW